MLSKQKRFTLIFFTLLTTILLAACANGETKDTVADEPNKDEATTTTTETTDNKDVDEVLTDGDLVIAVLSDAAVLDPQGSSDVPSANIQSNIFDALVKKDQNGVIIPNLAESWEPINEVTWEFKLRNDVTFHDGEAFNAAAVKKSLDRILDPEVAAPRYFIFEMISDVEVIDEFTIHIKTEYPFAPLLSHLAHPAGVILSPKSIDEDYAAMKDGKPSGTIISENPIGTSYFKFKSWNPGTEIVLEKNNDYWGDPAHLDTVTFKVIPESGTRIAELETGYAHIIEPVQPTEVAGINDSDYAKVDVKTSSSLSYIGFNVEKKPFDDVRVRQAISMLVNQSDILDGIYDGFGVGAVGPLAPGVFGHNANMKPLSYNPEEALKLLEEAGYKDGFSTTIWTNDNQQRIDSAVVLQEELKQANINVEIEVLEWGAYLDKIDAGEQDMFILGLSNPVGDADYFLRSLFHSESKGAPGNNSFYDNSKVDDLLDAGRQEIEDAKRIKIYDEVQEMLIEEAPLVYIHHQAYLTGVSNKIEGYWIDTSGYYKLKDVKFID